MSRNDKQQSRGLGSRIHKRFEKAGYVELDLPTRDETVRSLSL